MPDSDQQPATRQDLTQLEARLTAHIDQATASLAARLERAETTLLTGFHSYVRRESARAQSFEVRLNEVEKRLLDIEEQLGHSPA